jgi:trehalose 6-phosphate phosphatase
MTRPGGPPVPESSWAYFLDLDGTLVAIESSPRGVRIDRSLRRLIEALHEFTDGAVALITGRPIADVDRLFPGIRLAAAGQHGLERRKASGVVSRHRFPSRRLDGVRCRLAEAVTQHPGLLLEDKGLSLALHYRMVPRLAGYAHRLARTQVTRLGRTYCLRSGKRVVEIGPAGKDKGKAIQAFMRERPFRWRTPVFLGDDVTDEYGFLMVNRLGGHSIKVGPGPTAARWRLRDVAAVRVWLQGGRTPIRATR